MQNNSSPKPTIEYWHVWTDNDGISHQSRCQIEYFIEKGIAPDTSPQWLSNLKQSGATTTFFDDNLHYVQSPLTNRL
ncbi:MAG: hypothetical protein V7K50_24155 [Nostoc sp.]|uniref:hypothetical protein n=1 Tax=Nostoc sp. TaxID=1180 RepID=UPI002FF5F7E7